MCRPGAGEHPLVLFRDCHEACMRSAEAHWHAETLGGSHDYVHSEFSGWRHQTEGKEVGGYRHTDTRPAKMVYDPVEGPQVSTRSRKGN